MKGWVATPQNFASAIISHNNIMVTMSSEAYFLIQPGWALCNRFPRCCWSFWKLNINWMGVKMLETLYGISLWAFSTYRKVWIISAHAY